MKKTVWLVLALAACLSLQQELAATKKPKGGKKVDFYSFTMNDIDGKPSRLADYKGKALLLVNVASRCGNTPQYKGLEAMYEKYRSRGFEILAFPANDFGRQEPGDASEIKEFCSVKYHITFPLFAKIEVTGKNAHPLYRFLTTQTNYTGDIEWNFGKFLVDRQGKVAMRFSPDTQPEDPGLVAEVEKALAAPAH